MRRCKICGLQFNPRNNSHIYCSLSCRKKADAERKKKENEIRRIREFEEQMKSLARAKAKVRIKPFELMTEDELLHYGRTQTAAQLGRM